MVAFCDPESVAVPRVADRHLVDERRAQHLRAAPGEDLARHGVVGRAQAWREAIVADVVFAILDQPEAATDAIVDDGVEAESGVRAAVKREVLIGRVRGVVLARRRVVDVVGHRQQVEHLLPQRVDAPIDATWNAGTRQRNLIARERLARIRIDDRLERALARSVGVAEVGLREVAGPLEGGWVVHPCQGRRPQVIGELLRHEEERLAAFHHLRHDHRSADPIAGNVHVIERLAFVPFDPEVVVGVPLVAPHVVPGGSLEPVRSRFGGDDDQPAVAAAILRGEAIRYDLHFADRIDVRIHHRVATELVDDTDAVDDDVLRRVGHAVDRDVAHRRPGREIPAPINVLDAGHDGQQTKQVAPFHLDVGQLLGGHRAIARAAGGLHARGLGGDRHRVGKLADFQLQLPEVFHFGRRQGYVGHAQR